MNNQVSVRTSMVRFCTIISFSILFFLTSCTGLLTPRVTQRGSFSITISEDIIRQLENSAGYARVARSADSPVFTATVALNRTSGGSLIEPVSITGSSVQLVNRTIVIDNVPLGVQFTVTMTFQADGIDIISGTSNPVTLTTTDVTDIPLTLRFSAASTPFYSNLLIGTWAFDGRYNKALWSDNQITFNEDHTFETCSIDNSSYSSYSSNSEWDKGIWSVHTEQGNMILELHLTQWTKNIESGYQACDVKMYYTVNADGDELFLNRYKRIQNNEDYRYFDPSVINHFYRVKNGTVSQLLEGKWTLDKIRTPDFDYDETWTFNADGTMTSDCSDFEGQILTGTYDITEENGKVILHEQLTVSEGITEDWWYEYSSYGPDLIRADCFKVGNDEHEEPVVNYYYRDVPLVEYTYHIEVYGEDYTFTDCWPEGETYTLLDFSKCLYIKPQPDFPGDMFDLALLGWYNDESLSGSAVSSISAGNNTTARDFYAKWSFKGHHNGNDEGYCWSTNLYTKDPLPTLSFHEGDMVLIHLEADLSRNINGWTQIKFWGGEGYDREIGIGETEVHTTNRHLSADYYINTTVESTAPGNITIEVVYNQETGPVTFSNYNVEILDNTNSYRVDYHVGGRTYKDRVPAAETKILPGKAEYFDKIEPDARTDFNASSLEIVGWYNDSEFTTSPITAVSPLTPGEKQDVYLKFNPLIVRWDDPESHDGRHNYSVTLPAETLLSGEFNPHPGQTLYFHVEAQLSHDLNGSSEIELADGAYGFNWLLDGDTKFVKTTDGKLDEVYAVHLYDDMDCASVKDWCIDFVYNPDAYDDIVEITDYKVTCLNESEALFDISYHFGNEVYTEQVPRGSFHLPDYMMYFEHFARGNIAHHIAPTGWYETPDFSSEPIESFYNNSGTGKDVYIKVIPQMEHGEPDENGCYGYWANLPAKALLSDDELSNLTGTSTILLTAATNRTFNTSIPCNLNIVDTSHDWDAAHADATWTYKDGILTAQFQLNPVEGRSLPSADNMLIHIDYEKDFYNKNFTDDLQPFESFNLIILDESNSYNIVYHFGNMTCSERVYCYMERTLPAEMHYFENFNGFIANNLTFGGWYDNDSYPISSISSGSVAPRANVDVTMNIIPKMERGEPDEQGNYAWFMYLPAQMFLKTQDLSDLNNGNRAKARVSAVIPQSLNPNTPNYCGLFLVDSSTNEWVRVASASTNNLTRDEFDMLEVTFVLEKISGESLPNLENMLISFEYTKQLYDGDLNLSSFWLSIEQGSDPIE